MASVTLDAVGKLYGKTRAIEDVHLDVADGEFLVLVGPSGCGKSTLLRALNRLHDLNEDVSRHGQIHLDGHDIHDPRVAVAELRRRVGMVFQDLALFPNRSVRIFGACQL